VVVHFTIPSIATDLSLLLVRLVVGFSFLVAARNKSKNIHKFATSNGLPVPAALVVMTAEFMSGTALLLGIFPQIAALVIMLLMLGTMRLHIFKWKSPYWANKGGWEYDLILFTMASVIAIHGGGRLVFVR
jgi:putative oxidoreductase